ncbi:MAG: GNAT family N-acetyltransferase [Ilumatobacteraceae bacterium]|jgi:hypothetical protein
MDIALRKDDQAQRYELLVDGRLASYTEWFDDGDRVVMPHTVTIPAFRGQGLAAQVVRFALDDLATRATLVVPACWFVADFIEQHPEYQALVAPA